MTDGEFAKKPRVELNHLKTLLTSLLFIAVLLLGVTIMTIRSSNATTDSPTKSWFLHSRYANPFYAGTFNMNEQPPEITGSDPESCGTSTQNGSIWGCFYFVVSQTFSLNVTSVTFVLDPSYRFGLQLLGGTATLRVSMRGSIVPPSTNLPFSGPALFNISLTGPSNEIIGTTVSTIVIPHWSNPTTPVWNTTTMPFSIPQSYVIPPQEPVHLVIKWLNPSNENEIDLSFNTTVHSSNLTLPVSFYPTSLSLGADGSTSIRLGETVHFRGHLTDTWDGSGVGGATVSLIAHNATSYYSWKESFVVANVTTSETGDYVYDWSPRMGDFGIVASFAGSMHFGGSNYSYLAVSVSKAFSQLTIGLSVPMSYPGFSVVIGGTLTGLNGPVGSADIVISFRVPGSESWNVITSAITNSDGRYTAVWIPQATGNFTLRASWSGSDQQDFGEATASLVSSAPQGSGPVWVGSTGTVSALTFDPQTRVLSFNLSGPIETGSTVVLYLPKSLSSSAPQATLKVSDSPVSYKVQDAGTAWIISFTVPSGSSNMSVIFGPLEAANGGSLLPDLGLIIPIGLAFAVTAVICIALFLKRRSRLVGAPQ